MDYLMDTLRKNRLAFLLPSFTFSYPTPGCTRSFFLAFSPSSPSRLRLHFSPSFSFPFNRETLLSSRPRLFG